MEVLDCLIEAQNLEVRFLIAFTACKFVAGLGQLVGVNSAEVCYCSRDVRG